MSKRKPSLKGVFYIFLFTIIISMALFYIYFRVFTIWILFLIAFFILLFGSQLSISRMLMYLNRKYPSYFPIDFDPVGIAFLLSSILALFFYYLTKSIIIAIIFYIFLFLGIGISKIRKIKFVNVILIPVFLIAFFFSYIKRDILLFIFSVFMLTSLSGEISKFLGKNLEKKILITSSGSLFIISLSIVLLSIHFFEIEMLYLLGLLASTFFGIVFLDQFLTSHLKNILISDEKDTVTIRFLSTAIFSFILFGIFFLYDHNILIYVAASFCLVVGGLSLKLFLKKKFLY